MLIQPDIVVNSIKETLSTFILTVLPTLFPFILCSQMILMLNGARIIGYPLIPLIKILKLDTDVAGAYATSLIGGYPSGSASLSLLHSKGRLNRNYLVSMILCSNCGPMFVIGTIGTVLLNSYGAGIVILLSHILGGVISAFIFSTIKGEPTNSNRNKVYEKRKSGIDIFHILDKSILNTSKIMVKIFAFMGLFKLIGDAIFISRESVEGITIGEVFFRGSLELLDGCVSASRLDFYLAATAICAIVSFGGLSAVFQSISVSKEVPYSKPMFVLGKICHGIISGLLCFTFIRFIPYSIDVFAQQRQEILNLQFPIPDTVLLLIAGCVVYILFRSVVSSNRKKV